MNEYKHYSVTIVNSPPPNISVELVNSESPNYRTAKPLSEMPLDMIEKIKILQALPIPTLHEFGKEWWEANTIPGVGHRSAIKNRFFIYE